MQAEQLDKLLELLVLGGTAAKSVCWVYKSGEKSTHVDTDTETLIYSQ
ncbi:uncharacterized, partial [Tachysurus ichikawai]